MSITYTWKIEALDQITALTIGGVEYANVVEQVHWRLIGTNADGVTADVYGASPLDTSAIDSGSFVEAADLPSATVAEWAALVINASDASRIPDMKAKIAAAIAEKVSPSRVSGIPDGMSTTVPDSEVAV